MSCASHAGRAWPGRLALLAASTLIALLLAEGAVRALLWRNTPAGMVFDAEVMYGFLPSASAMGLTMNDVGLLGDDLRCPKQRGEIRVLLLGGSTSFSRTYVDALRRTLQGLCDGRAVLVASAGRPRYTSHVNRVHLERRLLALDPDVLVLYMGINDNVYDAFPDAPELPRIGYFDWTSRRPLLPQLLGYHLVAKPLRATSHFADRDLRSVPIFRRNVAAIITLARERGIGVVLGAFAIAHPTSDARLARTIAAAEPTMEHFWGDVASTAAGVAAHNAVTRELATAHGLPLVEVQDLIPRDGRHFTDICHHTAAGSVLLGRAMAQAVAHLSRPCHPRWKALPPLAARAR